MKRIFIVLFTIAVLVAISGCAVVSFWQVVTVTPYECSGQSAQVTDAYVFHEDNAVDFIYDFWTDGGNAGFLLVNNGDGDVTVDLGRSHFIKNGISNDYYLARTYVEEKGYAGDYVVKGRSVMVKEKRYVIVPAHSSRYFSEYSVSNTIFTQENLERFPTSKKEPRLSFDNPEDSPVIFENRVALVCEDGSEHKIIHKFYVSEIVNVNGNRVVKSNSPFTLTNSTRIYYNTYESPRKYYNIYNRRVIE